MAAQPNTSATPLIVLVVLCLSPCRAPSSWESAWRPGRRHSRHGQRRRRRDPLLPPPPPSLTQTTMVGCRAATWIPRFVSLLLAKRDKKSLQVFVLRGLKPSTWLLPMEPPQRAPAAAGEEGPAAVPERRPPSAAS